MARIKFTHPVPERLDVGDVIIIPEDFRRSLATCRQHGLSAFESTWGPQNAEVEQLLFSPVDQHGLPGMRILYVNKVTREYMTKYDRAKSLLGNLFRKNREDGCPTTEDVTVTILPEEFLKRMDSFEDGCHDNDEKHSRDVMASRVLTQTELGHRATGFMTKFVKYRDIDGATPAPREGEFVSGTPGAHTHPDLLTGRIMVHISTRGAPVQLDSDVTNGYRLSNTGMTAEEYADSYVKDSDQLSFLRNDFASDYYRTSTPPLQYRFRLKFLRYLMESGCKFLHSDRLNELFLSAAAAPMCQRAYEQQGLRLQTLVDTRKSLENAIKLARKRYLSWKRIHGRLIRKHWADTASAILEEASK